LVARKLFMKKIYLITAVIVVITSSIVPQLSAAEALRPARPRLPAKPQSAARRLSRRLRRLVNNWVATALAHREQQAALFALRKLSDAEFKDFGVYRGSLGSAEDRHRGVKFGSQAMRAPR
jgi:uncharacterized protein YjiS (DUF1127 family)